MLPLSQKHKIDKKWFLAANLCDRIAEEDLAAIGTWVKANYERDLQSRSNWTRRMQAGMDLALQVTRNKTSPWPDCANIAFPLVTIAALQFHSRAYPALVSGTDIVKYRVPMLDESGEKAEQAYKIGTHMSYQLLEEDTAWEEQHDRLLIQVPIVGCAFKKSYHSSSEGHNISELVAAKDFVIDYYAKSVETARCKTHIIPLYRNDIYERVQRGIYRDVLKEPWFDSAQQPMATDAQNATDNRVGLTPPQADSATPFVALEQHCYIDFDGDGYEEPYVITVDEASSQVLRIAARFSREEDIERKSDGTIIKITSEEYFTKYGFIPSPDGSIYDIGFGVLLGPLNETVNTIINQMIDAGSFSMGAGGFIGKGAKLRGGSQTFRPREWKQIDAMGDDLRKSIVPLETREPSAVLFQLLGLIISYADRIPGSTEALAGENPGQNTKADTMHVMVEQGLKVYGAIFKRIWRSMKAEFKKLYFLNAQFLSDSPNAYGVARQDYRGDPNAICPVADPNVASDTMRMAQARLIAERAAQVPGYNMAAVEENLLRALKIDGWRHFYVGVEKTGAPEDPKLKIAQLKEETARMALQQEHTHAMMQLMLDEKELNGKLVEMEAKARLMAAEAEGVQAGQQIALINAAIAAMKTQHDQIRDRLQLMIDATKVKADAKSKGTNPGRIPGVDPSPNYGSRKVDAPSLDGGVGNSVGLGSIY